MSHCAAALLCLMALPNAAICGEDKAEACLKRLQTVMEANSPELLVLPNEEELSAFTTSRLHVNVDWNHIDALINSNGDKWCVGTYLVEYGPHKYERRKRESVSNSADVSPSLGRDATSWTLVVEDNCMVNSVHLVIIPSVPVKGNNFNSQPPA